MMKFAKQLQKKPMQRFVLCKMHLKKAAREEMSVEDTCVSWLISWREA